MFQRVSGIHFIDCLLKESRKRQKPYEITLETHPFSFQKPPVLFSGLNMTLQIGPSFCGPNCRYQIQPQVVSEQKKR